jgi:hypothetical protein
MSNYDLLADLREWAESYDAVETGADGVLYNAINRIEQLNKRNKELEAALRESYKFEETLMRISHLADQHPVFDDALKAYTRCASIARAALGEKKNG